MAEFCLECLQKLDGRQYDPKEFVISDDLALCEGCGQWKHVVVMRRSAVNFGIINAIKALFRKNAAKLSG